MFWLSACIFLFGTKAHANDPALDLLRTYEARDTDKEIEVLLEQVAIKRLNDRVVLLPDPVKNVNLRTAVDRQVDWYYGGMKLFAAMNNLYALTSGELAERTIMDHLALPPQNWLGRRNHGEKQLAQLEPTRGTYFKVVPESSMLKMEYGVSGNGNGNFDLGEWALIDVALKPVGEPVLYSTSAEVSASDTCLWATELPNADHGEFIVGEFRSDRRTNVVSVAVYVSEDCTPGSTATVVLSVSDTKLGSEVDSVPIRLKVAREYTPLSVEPIFDFDDAGYSEARAPAFHLDASAELSVNLTGQPANTVLQRHVLPGPNGGISVAPAERGGDAANRSILTPMVPVSPGRWIADNDLDFDVGPEAAVGKWLKAMDRPWGNAEKPEVPFAADFFMYPKSKTQFSQKEKVEMAIAEFSAKYPAGSSLGDRVTRLEKVADFERIVRDAMDNPDRESSKETFRFVEELFLARKPPPQGTGGYAYRRIYMVPIDYQKPIAAPPPPPPEVVIAPLPRPVAPPPPEPEDPTTFAIGLGTFKPTIFQREFDDVEPNLDKSGPLVRILVGGQWQALIDAGGLSDGTDAALFELSMGVRYNLLYLPEVRFGPHLTPGIRYLSAIGESETLFMAHGGISLDVFPVRNFGVWVQASSATPSPRYVGKDEYRIAVQPSRIAWGAELAF